MINFIGGLGAGTAAWIVTGAILYFVLTELIRDKDYLLAAGFMAMASLTATMATLFYLVAFGVTK